MDKKSENSTLAETIYSGAASFGVLIAFIGAVIGTIIAIVLFIIGIAVIKNVKEVNEVSGKILEINGSTENVECQKILDSYSCFIEVEYNYNGADIKQSVQYDGNKNFYKGQIVNIWVETSNPYQVYLIKPPSKLTGFIILFVGLLIGIAGWVWYWITKKWKFAAAASGVGNAVDIVF